MDSQLSLLSLFVEQGRKNWLGVGFGVLGRVRLGFLPNECHDIAGSP